MQSAHLILTWTALLLAWGTAPGTALAASKLATCSLNGVTVQSYLEVGFAGLGSTPSADFDIRSATDQISPTLGFHVDAFVHADKPPAAGDPKDVARGESVAYFEYGVPTGPSYPQDEIQLVVVGVASSISGFNSAGNPSSAEVIANSSVLFHLDVVPGHDCDAFVHLSGLRALRPFEILYEISVIKDPGTLAASTLLTVLPGSPDQVVALPEGHGYELRLDYQFSVPFGVDPPFDVHFEASVSSAPTLPMPRVRQGIGVLLMLTGAVGLVARRSQAGVAG